jgi:hypothetical protein
MTVLDDTLAALRYRGLVVTRRMLEGHSRRDLIAAQNWALNHDPQPEWLRDLLRRGVISQQGGTV